MNTQPEQIAKKPDESLIMMTELVLPNDTNQLGNLLGGRLMHWIDIAAALSAMKHASKVCVTASVDEINFSEPIKLGHIVTLHAKVTRVFNTSMEISVRTTRTDPFHGSSADAGNAYLTFVAIDQYGKPIPIVPLVPETDEDKQLYDEAGLRRTQRLKNRELLKELRARNQESPKNLPDLLM